MDIETKYLQVLKMPNGEIIHQGKTIGWGKEFDKYLFDAKDVKAKTRQKITIDFTAGDLEDLQNGETFDWTYTTQHDEDIDVHLYNEDYQTPDDLK